MSQYEICTTFSWLPDRLDQHPVNDRIIILGTGFGKFMGRVPLPNGHGQVTRGLGSGLQPLQENLPPWGQVLDSRTAMTAMTIAVAAVITAISQRVLAGSRLAWSSPIHEFKPWYSQATCHYAHRWARVKFHYRLPISRDKREVVVELLRDCR